MPEVELSAGIIGYEDTGGEGPVVDRAARHLPLCRADPAAGRAPAAHAGRRDQRSYVLGAPPRAELLRWMEALRGFDRPALLAWAAEDRVMPPEHGRRLAELLPRGRHVEIADSYTHPRGPAPRTSPPSWSGTCGSSSQPTPSSCSIGSIAK